MSGLPDSVFVVIPALNEASVVGEVIEQVRRVCPNVVLVNDGSSDETALRARLAGARVISHAINLGQGAALQTGITYALRLGASHIVTFDADGQHDPKQIPALIQSLAGGADVALGTRFKGSTIDMPMARRTLLRVACWVNFALTGLHLSDAHNGLRAFTRAAAERLRLRQAGMAHATEIVAQVARLRLKYIEVPVTIRYTAYSLAKGQKLSNSVHILVDLLLKGLLR
ncbi:glycosyltransferase family 2 protein [Variovorax sp. OV329]|uniref:glycosyltransferase family 2 protein n=1 Tax=Variovorax sp. OV329 TaxID=1882825 RepID=UPI0008EDD522|nr:glycosyltransferase family 2 protein [Variovorax sp. OV329]SFL87632.1 Glycosyltransferase involved in cell wall bisynthesis [Variovorax sp. OV329]